MTQNKSTNKGNVGLVTFFDNLNIGAALQAFALKKTIADLGYKVDILNFTPNICKSLCPVIYFPNISLLHPKAALKRLRAYRRSRRYTGLSRIYRYERFVRRQIRPTWKVCRTVADLNKVVTRYDLLVSGSDQIWNLELIDTELQRNPVRTGAALAERLEGYRGYFLDFGYEKKRRRIAYGSSFGISELHPCFHDFVRDKLNHYDAIATREKTGSAIVHSLTGREVPTVLDPTLLINPEQWRKTTRKIKIDKPYIFCYVLYYDDSFRQLVQQAAEQTGYLIVGINKVLNNFGLSSLYLDDKIAPDEFLSLLDGAEFVLTTSFHGVAFSLNFGKKFLVRNCALATKSRIDDLLETVSLSDRIWRDADQNSNVIERLNDHYDEAQRLLELERSRSIEYLRQALAGKENPSPIDRSCS